MRILKMILEGYGIYFVVVSVIFLAVFGFSILKMAAMNEKEDLIDEDFLEHLREQNRRMNKYDADDDVQKGVVENEGDF